MPWGFGYGRGFGRGYGRGIGGGYGRGLGFWMTGLPGWARGWPRGGYCWYYYSQTGQFPPWSPWSYLGTQVQSQASQMQAVPSQDLNYLTALKASLETELKAIENQINELRTRNTSKSDKKSGDKK